MKIKIKNSEVSFSEKELLLIVAIIFGLVLGFNKLGTILFGDTYTELVNELNKRKFELRAVSDSLRFVDSLHSFKEKELMRKVNVRDAAIKNMIKANDEEYAIIEGYLNDTLLTMPDHETHGNEKIDTSAIISMFNTRSDFRNK